LAFGFPFAKSAKHVIPFSFESSEEYLRLVSETMQKLGWDIIDSDVNSVEARVRATLMGWAQIVTITIQKGIVVIESRCAAYQLLDWGKNARNIKGFLKKFEDIRSKEILGSICPD